MKIAMIGHKYIPSTVGGIEVAVGELAKGMSEAGHEVHIYNRRVLFHKNFYPNADSHQKHHQGARLLWIPTFARNSLNAPVYSILASFRAVFGGYDVVHIHAEGPAAMTCLFRLFRIPVAVTIHGLDWQRSKWGRFAKGYLLFGEKSAARLSNALIVLTRSAQEYFGNTYTRKTTYIPNGIALGERKKPDAIFRNWGLREDDYLLFLARIVPEKGLHYLLQAFSKLKTNKKLVIAGEIDLKNDYICHIVEKAKKDSRIVMTDFVSGETVSELYSNCSLYILPSDLEGMAIGLLEALSFGCRCVISDISENKETAGKYGIYFKHSDSADLRRVLEEELQKEESLNRRKDQLAFIDKRYSWQRTVKKTLHVYRELINEDNNGK